MFYICDVSHLTENLLCVKIFLIEIFRIKDIIMLDVRRLHKKYKNGFELKDISFHLNPGDFAVLFGADDSGKTALLYHIMGLHHFRKGEILIDGRSLLRLTDEERKTVRFVPDSVCVEPITLKEYFATLALMYAEYDEEDAVDLCEYFGVDMTAKLTEMSENENKLAMIIGAMVTAPKLLILDEPMNFLTAQSGVKLLGFLKFLASRGMTILITSERAEEVQDYCSHYLFLQNGVIAHHGLVKEVFRSQKAVTIKGGNASMVQSLLGTPVAKSGAYVTYLYDQSTQSRSLAEVLGLIAPEDFRVEDLSLEEVLNKDYARWI